jgi:hypothetical protein
MGPGLVVKACMQSAFSLMVFGWTQILIDIQPLIVMITGKGELHGFSHTYIGATLIAIASALTGKYFGEIGLRIVRMPKYNPIGWRVAIVSAFIGGYSHVFIDSIMHSDITPFSPFSDKSIFYRVVNIDALHILCIVSALVGGVGFYMIERIRKYA